MVRGTELFAALDACGADGLGLELAVDEGDGFETRQKSTTAAMILDAHSLLVRIAAEVEQVGRETPMPILRDGKPRHYPLAVGAEAPRLPVGSVILTGTPEGVALQAPSPLGVTLRGILRLRSPFAQALAEERARAAAAVPGGYLEPGDRIRASIDGLGAQIVRVVGADARLPQDPCAAP
jgi:2-keto-4-pentenoate hydratase/2-oxohepta-3-ene-1,7-dioic acid hydratase in catechol pathway